MYLSGMSKRSNAIHVATISKKVKDKVYQTHLLRRTYRESGKVKHQTLGNISHLPDDLIELIRRRLKGEVAADFGGLKIERSLPHGHVAAILGTSKQIGLDRVICSTPCRQRDLVMAMIAQRLMNPGSKLSAFNALNDHTATSTLGLQLKLGKVKDCDELYEAMDWLLKRQKRIEKKLIKKHVPNGALLLYDVSSSYYTGQAPSLARFGYNRDGKKGCRQIVFGLLCNDAGCPVSVEVFGGNTADPPTFTAQVQKLRKEHHLQKIVFVGDRGMITSRRIDQDLRPVEGLDWITALRTDQIRKLVKQDSLQLSLFDQQNLAEVSSPDFEGERLVVCRNPLLAQKRALQRQALLDATESELNKIVEATTRTLRPLEGKDNIGLRVGKVINKHKMGKHFEIEIEEKKFSFQRNQEKIDKEAALDGIYVIRTSLSKEQMPAEQVVSAYKDLSKVENAFRCLKTVSLKIRPIYHWMNDRIRAHVLLCMLAYYLEWHMRRKLASVLFDEHDHPAAEALRNDPVESKKKSPATKSKERHKVNEQGIEVTNFNNLLNDLATLTKNQMGANGVSYYLKATPTKRQQHIFELLNIKP